MVTITESQWVSNFGFQRFPFDRPEAGNEEFARPDFLASCFVEPRGFERVFGQADSPVTSLLFAARGTGKTACRVMMDYYCQNGSSLSRAEKNSQSDFILSIPHIRLDNVINIARKAQGAVSPTILFEYHALEIMRQAMPVFVNMVARNVEFADRLKNLSLSDFEDISLFLIYYSTYLSSPQKDFLRSLGVELPPRDKPMPGLEAQNYSNIHPPTWESVLYRERLEEASPLEHLSRWAKLVKSIGIKSTYILVDGVDELEETASEPNYAHKLIRPLLNNLRLMDETPHLALKFFLPSDLESLILTDRAFRTDRGFVIEKIQWREEDLIKILRSRINALGFPEDNSGTAMEFDALCVPEMRGEIEMNLARVSNGNPRYLMNLCSQMVAHHCSREIDGQDDPFLLNREDYYSAVEFVMARYRNLSSLLEELARKKTEPKDAGQEPAVFVNGQLIDDKYEVQKQLPPGASGQVYCVYDEVFERMYALKIFNNSDTAIDSFKNEARLLLKIDHPHIVKVYGWGILKQSQRFYMLSEFVDGTELTRYTLPGSLLPRQKAIQSVLELLSALEYLHPDTERLEELRKKMGEREVDQQEYDEYSRLNEYGLIHRDIKPSNVILSSEGVKLIDFNIASRAITVGNTFAGTKGYMLPEIGITRWSVDGDLFATGIMLYELLTGYHPYPDRQPFADTTPLNPMQYAPDITPNLADVILRAVSCNPEIRYHSARQFKSDLKSTSGI